MVVCCCCCCFLFLSVFAVRLLFFNLVIFYISIVMTMMTMMMMMMITFLITFLPAGQLADRGEVNSATFRTSFTFTFTLAIVEFLTTDVAVAQRLGRSD